MSLIIQVDTDSPAFDAGLKSGDRLIRINGHEINDQIDFSFHSSDEFLELEIQKKDGIILYKSLQRIYYQSLGISVIPPEINECDNACLFCFIHQQPKGMRRSLYVMDDDYRFSFSDGNFITLTNLKPSDWKRIYDLKLSPLYISVHSTEPEIRKKLIKHPRAGRITEQLKKLAEHGIKFHTQVVLCYGYNDKKHLDRTIEDLEKFMPYLSGIAVVPASQTQYRKNLPYLKPWDDETSLEVIEQVGKWQKLFREKYNETIVYLADEFYYQANRKFPPAKHYDGFKYIEDGVGTTKYFYHVFNKHLRHLPEKLEQSRTVTVVCGVIAEKYLKEAVGTLNKIMNLKVNLVAVENHFFGKGITVTGLLTATDIMYTLKNYDIGDELIIPSVTLRKEDNLFLDNYSVSDVRRLLKTSVKICPMGAGNFIKCCLNQDL